MNIAQVVKSYFLKKKTIRNLKKLQEVGAKDSAKWKDILNKAKQESNSKKSLKTR